MRGWRLLVVLAVAVGIATPAAALTRWGDPNSGKATLDAGFHAIAVAVMAGGNANASTQGGGVPDSCAGFVTGAPEYRFSYAGGAGALVVGVTAAGPASVVVSVPTDGGTWLCSPLGAAGVESAVTIEAPPAGVYNVWVGAEAGGARAPATLEIREGAAAAIGLTGLQPDAPPVFGTTDVTFPFARVDAAVEAGGWIDAGRAIDGNCAGWVTAAPTWRLAVTPTEGARLTLRLRQTRADTTLVVRGPDGAFVCGDDVADSFDAMVVLRTLGPGVYDVWVGTYAPMAPVAAVLRIAEPNAADALPN